MDEAKVLLPLGELQGKILSINNKAVYSFTGVPYASKPERFGLPKPCTSWQGTLDCTQESKLSYQINPLFNPRLGIFKGCPDDSLYLNVFTSILKAGDSSDLLPVIVFFHGGAFVIGGNTTTEYGPDILLSHHNVVLVTVNYRLGPFGFLNLGIPECPGNQGMHDQVESLKWVRSYISAFGGNPEEVTIMGQSAGGMSTLYHMVSPRSKGLFKRVICLSGAVWPMPLLHNDHSPSVYARRLAGRLGLKDDDSPIQLLEELRSISPKKLLREAALMNQRFVISCSPWIPTIDSGYLDSSISFLPGTFKDLILGRKGNPVESIVLGYTAQDGLCYASDAMKRSSTWDFIQKDWSTSIPVMFFNREIENVTEEDRTTAERLFKMYYGEECSRPLKLNKENFRRFEKLATDLGFLLPIHETAKGLHGRDYKVYGFKFDFIGSMTLNDFFRLPTPKFIMNIIGRTLDVSLFRDPSHGTAHGDDLLYIFPFNVPGFSNTLATHSGRRASNNLRNMILSFANSGDPSGDHTGSNLKPHQWPHMFYSGDYDDAFALLNDRAEGASWEMDSSYDGHYFGEVFKIVESRHLYRISDRSKLCKQTNMIFD